MPEGVIKCVGFEIRLVNHIEAEFVAEIQPVGIVRIVRAAHGVEIVPLHGDRVQAHRFAVKRFAFCLVVVVPVDAMNHHAASID